MIELIFIAEDTKLTASFTGEGGPHWHVEVSDMMSGKHQFAAWNYQQLGAVLYLMAGTGEDERTDQELTAIMYSIAEPLFEGWLPELRPIP